MPICCVFCLLSLPVLMQCCGCALITLPPSAAGTTCTSMTETPFTPLWLLSTGERLLLWIGESWERGGNMEMIQEAFGTASIAPTIMQSNDFMYRQTKGVIIERKYCNYSHNPWIPLLSGALLHNIPPQKDNQQACGWHSFIWQEFIKKIYLNYYYYSAPLGLISCWEFSCSQEYEAANLDNSNQGNIIRHLNIQSLDLCGLITYNI